jgi:hypothetical protein
VPPKLSLTYIVVNRLDALFFVCGGFFSEMCIFKYVQDVVGGSFEKRVITLHLLL